MAKYQNNLIAALGNRRVWLYLAWQDIRIRYRRSKLGPFWITLSMGVFCLALGVVYSKLFGVDTNEYMPFLICGYVFWGFISSSLSESSEIFQANAAYLKDIKINPLEILLRFLARQLIVFSHNALIIFFAFIFFGIMPQPVILLAIPGMVLAISNIAALIVIFSMLGLRYRDVQPIIVNMVTILFLVTPIMWFPKLLGGDSWIMLFNPFASYLDLFRAPLLGSFPNPHSWLVSLLTLLLFGSCATLLYRKKGNNIPFWL